MNTVRAMTKADVNAVYEIEVLSFRTPWSKHSLAGELKNSVAHYCVLETEDGVVGYCGMWVLFEEAHITNIAIMPGQRGRGFGKLLLLSAMRVAESFGAEMMTLEVRETNAVAQRMYAETGFVQQGYRKRYYSDTGEGALLLWNRNIHETTEQNAESWAAVQIQFDTF